jgi:hypothetical protein
MKLKQWAFNSLLSIDQTVNCILFWGDPDSTISARLAYSHYESWMRKTVDWIFWKLFNQNEHCASALERELNKKFNEDAIYK